MDWVLALMLFLQPEAPWRDTYKDTARAIADVVDEEPALFDGEDANTRTTTLLVATAYGESRFRPDAVGDHGQSRGLYGRWGARAKVLDPVIETRLAMSNMRTSMEACERLPPSERLAAYASGSCAKGRGISRARMDLATRLLFVSRVPL
ncbi:hypothetical protein LVJ94_02720 [Pendulispora rubella]|uniref:Uncharacterized protein n=1 Tax=Pendulispora rubella TaxID=2741070 RepID=A0ABZ2L730_9BACT